MLTSTSKQQRTLPIHIRWMIRRDFPAVLAIEAHSFDMPWDEEDFIRCLRQRNCIGMVAEHEEQVVGFMVYELLPTALHVLNFAVHEDWRYKGVGRQMAAKMAGKLSSNRRRRIDVVVRETNVDAQLFFRAVGFRCVETLREFEVAGEDGYLFCRQAKEQA